jgi:hypothetical protein
LARFGNDLNCETAEMMGRMFKLFELSAGKVEKGGFRAGEKGGETQ